MWHRQHAALDNISDRAGIRQLGPSGLCSRSVILLTVWHDALLVGDSPFTLVQRQVLLLCDCLEVTLSLVPLGLRPSACCRTT